MSVAANVEWDLDGGFMRLLGASVTEASGELVVIQLPVSEALLQTFGIVHGGVYCALSESAASIGGALWLTDGRTCAGVANHTNFLHAVRSGLLVAQATPIHRGRTSQLWNVRIHTDREVARSEVRLANLDDPRLMGNPGSNHR
ncbi:MAG: PaaI family thioesterase [Mycobacteriales bacterium]